MRRHKVPPQGTGSIVNHEKQESMIEWGADNILTDISIRLKLIELQDKDYLALVELKIEGMLSDKRAGPHLMNMYAKYPRWVVGRAFSHLKFSPWQVFVPETETETETQP